MRFISLTPRAVAFTPLLPLAGRENGWPTKALPFSFAAIKSNIAKLARLGDELEISTWVSDVRHSTAIRHYAIHRLNDHTLLAEIHALGVWVNLATGQPIRIPTRLIDDFTPNIVG